MNVFKQEFEDWNRFAEHYKGIHDMPLEKYCDEFISENVKAKGLVLDVGCGVRKVSGIGIDFSKNLLKIAKKDGGKFVCCSASHLAFRGKTFDTVIANRTFHHLLIQGILNKSIKQLDFVTKDNAVFYVIEASTHPVNTAVLNVLNVIRNVTGGKLGFPYLAVFGSPNETTLKEEDYKDMPIKFKRRIYFRTFFFGIFVLISDIIGLFSKSLSIWFQKNVMGVVKKIESNRKDWMCSLMILEGEKK